jgi:predicted nucleic acid-binding protein
MAAYMLDTDISSYIMKRSDEAVLRKLQQAPIDAVCISVITKSELLFGVEVSPRRLQDQPTPNLWTDAWLAALALSLDYEMANV